MKKCGWENKFPDMLPDPFVIAFTGPPHSWSFIFKVKLSWYFYLLTTLINSFHKIPMHTFNLLNTKAQQTHEFSALTKAQPHSIFQTD